MSIINNMKIRTKLIVIYLVVVVVTVTTVGVYFTTRMSDIVIDNAKKEARYNNGHIKQSLEETLRLAITTSDMIFQDEKLHGIVKKQYENYGDVVEAYNDYPILSNYLKYYNGLSNIRLYVENDTILDNSNVVKVTESVNNNEWYRKAIEDKGIITWKYKNDEISNDDNLSLIRDINCDVHGHIGVLVISVKAYNLEKIVSEQLYPLTILLDGIVIASGEFEEGKVIDFNYKDEEISYFSELEKEFNVGYQYIISNKFKVDKSFNNIFEVIVNIPINQIVGQAKKVVEKSIIIIVIAITLSLIAILFFSKNFSNRINLLTKEMNKVVKGNFDIKKKIDGNDEVGELYNNLYKMMESIKKLINEVYVKELQQEQLMVKQKDAEFKMLASQINPHFLYNTLETIRMRALCNGDKELASIVKKLGKLMRRNLEVSSRLVSLESELDLVKSYLEIQALRFKGKVKYEFNIEVDTKKYKLLPLLIQPLVENAFVHGLENSVSEGKMEISIFQDIGYLIIEVSDNGVGIDSKKLEYINRNLRENLNSDNIKGKKSIGISNVDERIKMLYGNEYGLYILSSLNLGTKVILLLPAMEEELML